MLPDHKPDEKISTSSFQLLKSPKLSCVHAPGHSDTLPDSVRHLFSRSSVQCAGQPLRMSSSDDGRRPLCLSGNDPGLLLHQHHPHLPLCWSCYRSDLEVCSEFPTFCRDGKLWVTLQIPMCNTIDLVFDCCMYAYIKKV